MNTLSNHLSGTALALGLAFSVSLAQAQDAPPAPKPADPAPAAEAPKPVIPAPALPAAPAQAAPKETDVILEVDGTPITVLDVRELFTARYGRQFEQMPQEQRAMIEPQIQQMVMNELIQKALLTNAAEKEGMKVEAAEIEASLKEIAAQVPEGETLENFAKSAGVSLDRIRGQIAIDTKIRKLFEKVTAGVEAPGSAEVKKYFEEHPEVRAEGVG
jgi:copper chaperone CopZ